MNPFFRSGLTGLGLSLTMWTGAVQAGSFSKDARGTSAATLLTRPADARRTALGGTTTALLGRATDVHGNIAGLAALKEREAAFSYSPSVEETRLSHAVYAHPTGGGVLAGGFSYFSAGQMEKTDDTGSYAGDFHPSDRAVSIAFARAVGGWSVGAAGKYVTTTVVESDSALAVDAGVVGPALFENRLRWAASLRNVGEKVTFGSTSRPLPLEAALGCAVVLATPVTVTADVLFPRDNAPFAAVGMEGRISPTDSWGFTGRVGWNGRSDPSLNGLAGFSLGFGLGGAKWGLDYAFSPLGEMGNVHQATVRAAF